MHVGIAVVRCARSLATIGSGSGKTDVKLVKTVLLVAGVLVVVAGAVVVAAWQGLLSPFGVGSETSDSQVIQAVERTQEVSLLSLSIQGITSERRDREVFGQSIPGSGETVFIQYEFDAKLGVDGSGVDVRRTGGTTYTVSVPDFRFIGYDDPTFEVAVEDNGILSWTTPDIDQVEMVNDVLDDDARDTYLEKQRSALEDQTKVFYDSLILGIDPQAETTYEFSS